MRVLVVDDQPDAGLALTDLLGALGVGTASRGEWIAPTTATRPLR